MNNRISNLRDVTRNTNMQNQRGPRADNTSGFLGVSFYRRLDKWEAGIYVAGRRRHIGVFTTAEEASAAYLAAKRELHAGCTL